MRYLVGFVLFLLALGTLRVVGCGDEGPPPECRVDEDCDDGNPCTDYHCKFGDCQYPLRDEELILPCELNGVSGFCIDGVCQENPCVSDDSCFDEAPRYDGECLFTRIDPDGTPCEANGVVGVCINLGLDDMGCHADNPCEGVVCEGDVLCVNDDTSRLLYYCDYRDGVCKQKAESCSDYDMCTYDRCDPETGDCFYPVVPDGVSPYPPSSLVCCNGILCRDDNECTSDTCDLETRECAYMPVPDGEQCCLREEERCGICIPGPCCYWACVDWGSCNSGVCE